MTNDRRLTTGFPLKPKITDKDEEHWGQSRALLGTDPSGAFVFKLPALIYSFGVLN